MVEDACRARALRTTPRGRTSPANAAGETIASRASQRQQWSGPARRLTSKIWLGPRRMMDSPRDQPARARHRTSPTIGDSRPLRGLQRVAQSAPAFGDSLRDSWLSGRSLGTTSERDAIAKPLTLLCLPNVPSLSCKGRTGTSQRSRARGKVASRRLATPRASRRSNERRPAFVSFNELLVGSSKVATPIR